MARKQSSTWKQKYDIFSVLSFVFGVIPFLLIVFQIRSYDFFLLLLSPVSIILGIIGEGRIKNHRFKGKIFARSGIILGAFFLIYLIFFGFQFFSP